jgi:hypothetical protein
MKESLVDGDGTKVKLLSQRKTLADDHHIHFVLMPRLGSPIWTFVSPTIRFRYTRHNELASSRSVFRVRVQPRAKSQRAGAEDRIAGWPH